MCIDLHFKGFCEIFLLTVFRQNDGSLSVHELFSLA